MAAGKVTNFMSESVGLGLASRSASPGTIVYNLVKEHGPWVSAFRSASAFFQVCAST